MTQLSQSRLQKYPSISDLQKRAKQRLPLIAWEYLDMGTGEDIAVSRNRDAYWGCFLLSWAIRILFDQNMIRRPCKRYICFLSYFPKRNAKMPDKPRCKFLQDDNIATQ